MNASPNKLYGRGDVRLPTYEYACTACGHQFEVVHRATETPTITCEGCGGATRKVFFPARVIFKGSGWHITDYGPRGEKNSNGDSHKSASDADAKSETKSEEKAAVAD
jgi:putative FmdB family regulatory protein